MARTLTKKRRGFVNDYADTGNATRAVQNNYPVKNIETARAMGSELLTFPNVQEELRKLGFDSNNAKRVIGEILNNEEEESKDRIKAAENIFKVNGDYAPDKSVNINFDGESTERTRELGDRILGLLRRGN